MVALAPHLPLTTPAFDWTLATKCPSPMRLPAACLPVGATKCPHALLHTRSPSSLSLAHCTAWPPWRRLNLSRLASCAPLEAPRGTPHGGQPAQTHSWILHLCYIRVSVDCHRAWAQEQSGRQPPHLPSPPWRHFLGAPCWGQVAMRSCKKSIVSCWWQEVWAQSIAGIGWRGPGPRAAERCHRSLPPGPGR